MVLMIYQDDIFKEVLLPNTDNQDYTIFLDREQFSLRNDLVITLEIVNQQWFMRDTKFYTISQDGVISHQLELHGGEILTLSTIYFEKFQCIVVNNDFVFKPYKKIDIHATKYITVGAEETNDISYTFMNYVSKNHCILFWNQNSFYVEDKSSNGVFINYRRVSGTQQIHFGDVLNIFGLSLVFFDTILAVQSAYGNLKITTGLIVFEIPKVELPQKQVHIYQREYYNRAPRIIPQICTEEITIDSPPKALFSKKRPLFNVIGPSFTMAIPMLLGCVMAIYSTRVSGASTSAFMYTGLITAVGSAVFGVMWAILNLRETKRDEVESEEKRFNTYGNYLLEISEYLKSMYARNVQTLYTMYPSASECCQQAKAQSILWSRNNKHEDFLYHRLGRGNVPFQVQIKISQQRFSMEADSLMDMAKKLYEDYKTLLNVPVGVDLYENFLWGILGGKHRAGCYQVVHNLIAQIAANNSYTDVKLVFCFDNKNERELKEWEYIKWLPHVWSENKKSRYFASNKDEASDVLYEVANIMRRRTDTLSEFQADARPMPHYVLFISDTSLLEGELMSKYVFDCRAGYGLTTVIFTDFHEKLPNSCDNIILNDGGNCRIYNLRDSHGDNKEIVYDDISSESLLQFSKMLANIEIRETGDDSNIPDSINFFEMHKVTAMQEFNVLDMWRKNRTYNSMKALIGQKADGLDAYLDIHEKYHGPHGLIAGTTGSGKSEIMQTYILSMSISYSPDDIAFFIIDFKGGGMANLFSNLPHMVGQISNLSGNQIRRAMISIKSENLRRQRLFGECGVNNINSYTRLYKNGEVPTPIPHLIIIIDEFAELKREEPDFMRELISVAQVGRSLGVHLILATQKPGGTVDDNILANSKFRLCLRVQDKQDSNDMISRPDAAFLTQVGRCYMQVGNDEIFELFQSGWSGAVYDANMADSMYSIATLITLTGKTAIVGNNIKMQRKEAEKNHWYKTLMHCILHAKELMRIPGSLSDMDNDSLSVFMGYVLDGINAAGFKYGESESEIRSLKSLISVFPENIEQVDDILTLIFASASMMKFKLPEVKDKTQLEAIVEYIKELSDKNGYKKNMQLWLPVLPSVLLLNDFFDMSECFDGKQWMHSESIYSLKAAIGLYDDPENQAQLPLYVNFSDDGHIAVCGSVVSGKSTFLQTMVYALIIKYTPAQLNMYMIDFSSGKLRCFENAPHVGCVMTENDQDKIGKFFNMTAKIMNERKKLLGGGNYSQYVKANGMILPPILIIIDNFAGFKEKTENAYEDILIAISREGLGYGIYLAISSAGFGMSEIQNRIGDNIKTVISLEMGDKFKYMDVLRMTNIPIFPEPDVKGRGLAFVDDRLLEFQTALSVKAEDDYELGQTLSCLCKTMYTEWRGECALSVPFIPDEPVFEDFSKLKEYTQCITQMNLLPFAYNTQDASAYYVDLSMTYCFAVTGKQRTGKTNVMKILLSGAMKKNGDVAVIEKSSNDLKRFARSNDLQYIDTDEALFAYFLSLKDVFIERNAIKNACLESGMSDAQIYEEISKTKPVFIFISDFVSFVDDVYNPSPDAEDMKGFLETIFEKGALHNIYFFSCINTDQANKVASYKIYQSYIGCKCGVHLGGNVTSQNVFNFQNIHYTEISKTMKKGIGLAASYEDDTIADKVIIPLYAI